MSDRIGTLGLILYKVASLKDKEITAYLETRRGNATIIFFFLLEFSLPTKALLFKVPVFLIFLC